MKNCAYSIIIYFTYANTTFLSIFSEVTRLVKAFRIISKVLSISALTVVVLLAVLLGGTRLFGLSPYTVASGSMEPTYHVGSVIYVTDTDPAELKVGDAITYRIGSGTVVTHRIAEIVNDAETGLAFRTKGDANKTEDLGAPVSVSNVIGKPVFSIPLLGFVSNFVGKPVGLIITLGSCLSVFIISFIIDAILPKPQKADEQELETEEG